MEEWGERACYDRFINQSARSSKVTNNGHPVRLMERPSALSSKGVKTFSVFFEEKKSAPFSIASCRGKGYSMAVLNAVHGCSQKKTNISIVLLQFLYLYFTCIAYMLKALYFHSMG